MNQDQNTFITRLETQVRQLILQYQKLQQEKADLEVMVMEGMQRVDDLKKKNAELQSQYDNLKMARILELGDTDTRNAKNRLAKLVRDVDKCIAILKAEQS